MRRRQVSISTKRFAITVDPDLWYMMPAELNNPDVINELEHDFEVGAMCTVITEDDIESEPESESDEDYLTEIDLAFSRPDPPALQAFT